MKEQITVQKSPKLLETKGIDLYNSNKPKEITVQDLLDKLSISYDEQNDIINIKCQSNLLIETENSIFISKNDTVFITGDVLGLKGRLFLNPVLQKFREIKNLIRGKNV